MAPLLLFCTLFCTATSVSAAATGAGRAADDFGHLLSSLRLGAHAQTFRAQEVLSGADLAILSRSDIAELGLTIGAANRLLAWQAEQHLLPPPAYKDTFDVRRYGADPNGNCCAERPIQAAINDSARNYAGDYSCGQGW